MRNTLLFKEERCSRPLYSSHTPHPEHTNTTTGSICIYPGHKDNHPHTTQPTNESHHSVRAPCAAPDTQQRTNASDKNRLIAQSCDTHTHPCVHLLEASRPPGACPPGNFHKSTGLQHHTRTLNSPTSTTPATAAVHHASQKIVKLLRKEVIQPHLPVRLPCYDFVPIADPTFDSSLTSLGHWLRVLPTFMT